MAIDYVYVHYSYGKRFVDGVGEPSPPNTGVAITMFVTLETTMALISCAIRGFHC